MMGTSGLAKRLPDAVWRLRMRCHQAVRLLRLSAAMQVVYNALDRRTLVCLGDSHIEPMWLVRDEHLLPRTRIDVEAVGGATASGIHNPHSRSNAYARYAPLLRCLNSRLSVLACLGEVDVGYLVFTRTEDPATSVETAVERYTEFLRSEILDRGARLIMVAVVPPLIEDYSTWAGPRGQRRDTAATWDERSSATKSFNNLLRQWCATHSVDFLDVWGLVTDQEGRVTVGYRNTDPQDHHLAVRPHALLLTRELARLGFR